MRQDMIIRLIDALVPGGAHPNCLVLPKASDTQALASAQSLLAQPEMASLEAAIEAFPAINEAALVSLAPQHRQAFAKLTAAVLIAYYEAPAVVAAFVWSNRPPQPKGFTLSPLDERLLDAVRSRAPFWQA